MYRRNNNGPRVDPSGSLHVISLASVDSNTENYLKKNIDTFK